MNDTKPAQIRAQRQLMVDQIEAVLDLAEDAPESIRHAVCLCRSVLLTYLLKVAVRPETVDELEAAFKARDNAESGSDWRLRDRRLTELLDEVLIPALIPDDVTLPACAS